MALTTQSATIGGATKTLIVAADGSSNIAAAHVTVDASGAEKGITANPLAVSGTFWQSTQAVSAATLPLPSGAATAAKQPALGTAGASSVDVLSVQGIASGTAINVVGNQGGYSIVAGGSFSRPANTTAYASGQLVGNSTTAASVVPVSCAVGRTTGGTGQIMRARLTKTGTSITNASFRIHLYRVSPTATNGDGATWLTDNAANYIGSLDTTMSRAFSDGAKGIAAPNEGSSILFLCAAGSQNLYALVEARAAYTPTSGETFTVALEALQD